MPSRKIVASLAMTAALATGGVVGVTLGNPLASSATENPTSTTVPADGAAQPGGRGPGRAGLGEGLDAAAKTLGMTTDDLKAALKDGKSLADIAAEKGVDKQKVVDALVAAGEQRLDEMKAKLPERMADLVERKGFGRGDHDGPGRPMMGAGLDAAAKALGMTTDDLKAALKDGKTLADIAADKGVDKQKVIDALVAEAKKHLDEEVASGDLTQAQADQRAARLTDMITRMVDGQMGGRGGFGHGRPGGPGGMGGMGDDPAADGGN